jgi:hypothetical protein
MACPNYFFHMHGVPGKATGMATELSYICCPASWHLVFSYALQMQYAVAMCVLFLPPTIASSLQQQQQHMYACMQSTH